MDKPVPAAGPAHPAPAALARRGLRTFRDGLPAGARVSVDTRAFARLFGEELARVSAEEASCGATE